MTADKPKKKHRRAKGSGSAYQQGRIWWIQYRGPDGKRQSESTGSVRKGDAERLLQRRVGARDNGLPVIKAAERLTFDDAAQAMIDDFTNSGKKSLAVVERRIRLHLKPYFGGRRLVGITPAEIRTYITKRKGDTIVVRKSRSITLEDGTEQVTEAETKPVSPGEINRELQILKRIFSLAVGDGKLARRPKIEMLREDNVRTGFLEPHHYRSVLGHLPSELRPVITFAYITGWRIASEVLPLEWRQIDFEAGEIRLDAGTTKNDDGRVFRMTAELRTTLRAQLAEHERLKKAGQIEPWVFFRMVAEGRGGPEKPKQIRSLTKAWRVACRAAGCPGRIPHDLRRTAVRNLVRAGVPERVAMKLTGHKTPSVFNRYNITSPADFEDAVRRLDAAAVERAREA